MPTFEDRLAVLEAVAASRAWLAVRVTEKRLIADVAAGYDAVIMGMDKWLQVIDPAWYGGSVAARDEAVAGLPRILMVARPPDPLPALPAEGLLLAIGAEFDGVSSSAARAGRREWMAAEAIAHHDLTGAWLLAAPTTGRDHATGGPASE